MRKKITRYFILIFSLFICIHTTHSSEKSVRGSIGWGFFAEFLWVLNHLHYCMTHNKIPVIYWGPSFAYYQKNGYQGNENGWEYYFEPVSHLKYHHGDPLIQKTYYDDDKFSTLWNYFQYIENLHLLIPDEENKILKVSNVNFKIEGPYPVGKQHLYNEQFRKYIKEKIINAFIHPKKAILDKVESFYQQYMAGKRTVGIHLRGTFALNEVPPVPVEFLLGQANLYANGDTQFFIATDQLPLLKQAKAQLKGKVIFFESERFDHSTAPNADKKDKLHPILGENIIIEMLLLSRCDYLIHTVSNVSTTVLYFNPTLKHAVLY